MATRNSPVGQAILNKCRKFRQLQFEPPHNNISRSQKLDLYAMQIYCGEKQTYKFCVYQYCTMCACLSTYLPLRKCTSTAYLHIYIRPVVINKTSITHTHTHIYIPQTNWPNISFSQLDYRLKFQLCLVILLHLTKFISLSLYRHI
jgi:hypothetical protein